MGVICLSILSVYTAFQKKMLAVDSIMRSSHLHSFSDNLKALYSAGLALFKEDSRLYRLGEDFATMQQPIMGEFMEKYKPETVDIYMKLLTQAMADDELRPNLDISLATSFITAIVNQTTMLQMKHQCDNARTENITREMLTFIEHAVLKSE